MITLRSPRLASLISPFLLLFLAACEHDTLEVEQTEPFPPALTEGVFGDLSTLPDLQRALDQAAHLMAAPTSFTAAPFAPDFVVTGSESLGGEHFFPSNGDGTFAARSNIPGLLIVDGMDVADMDRDGDNDVLVCDGRTREVYLYTNNGAGTFATSVVATGVTGSGPSSWFCTALREGDFNEDGRKDFVVGDNRVRGGTFVYLQTGPGTFTKVTPTLDIATWSSIDGNSLFGVAVGDVDGDGHQDILMLGYFGKGRGQVRFYKGDGTGGMAASTVLFNIGTDFSVYGTVGLALFDLDGDGDLDIIAGGGYTGYGIGGSGTHFVYTNNGNGTFTKPTGFVFDVNAQTGIDAFEFAGDGDHDLVVMTSSSKLLYVENLGGSLAAPVFVGSTGFGIGVGAPSDHGDVYLDHSDQLPVDIDIKPGSDPNSINTKSRGVIPVAVLTTNDFDATTVDVSTVAFGPAGAAPAHNGHIEDVDTDGDNDLILHFRTQDTGIAVGDTEACLTGQTFDGVEIEGCDAVRVVK